MKKAVIFDLDGTLMNTLFDLYNAVNRALAAFGMPLVTLEKVRFSVGNGVGKLVERCLPADRSGDYDAVLARFNAEYAQCKEDHTLPFDGVTETLTALKNAGVKIAVVSNKTESAVKELCAEEFSGLTDIEVGDDGVRPLKPDPAPVLYALSSLNMGADEAVYVGDQEVDIVTARNAGIAFVGAGWGSRGEKLLKAAGAQTVISDIRQLLPIVLQ